MSSEDLNILVDEELFNESDVTNSMCPKCKNELNKTPKCYVLSKHFKWCKCDCSYCTRCFLDLKKMERHKKRLGMKTRTSKCNNCKALIL